LTREFTLTYTGQLYQAKQDPEPLFQAVRELIGEGVIDPDNVKVQFFGPTRYWLDRDVKEHGLEMIVAQHGVVPRKEALAKQRETQVLLLLNWNDLHEKGIYSGKVFEYLAARRPILAIGGPNGVVSELLEETGAGVHVKDVTELKESLRNLYKEYQATGQVCYHGKEERVAKYSHREMARKFAEALRLTLSSK